MAYTVQDDEGSVSGANSYEAIANFKAYHDDRGNDYSSYSDTLVQQAMVKGTDYIDKRFRYVGEKRNNRQVTEWPRSNAYDLDNDLVTGVPHEIKEAAYLVAWKILTGTNILPDPSQTADGQALRIRSEKVGPISRTLHYVAGSYQAPRYPDVDMLLTAAGLVLTQSRDLVRS